jgi:RNA polymerase sigma factor for flagellar operon FliA
MMAGKIEVAGSGELQPPQGQHDQILPYLPLVHSIARRVHAAIPVNARVELHDLAQSGLLGLVSAGRSYSPETAVPFGIYARYRIEGEILDYLRRHDPAPRKLRRWQKQATAARRELTDTLKRQPTEEELCHRLMVTAVEMRSNDVALSHLPSGSAWEPDRNEPYDPACCTEAHPDRICSRQQQREVLGRLIADLPVRYQQVIRLYYCRHIRMKEIARTLGVSDSRASQMHRRALQTMGRMLRNAGISSAADV